VFRFLLLTLVLAGSPRPQSAPPPVPPATTAGLLDITVERKHDGKVEDTSPTHVFEPGDVIRLRLTSRYQGFLYVMDQGTSGRFSTVFPSADGGSDNRIRPGADYFVPAVDEGWFEIQGPAGFDILYFLLSPAPLATPSPAAFAMPGNASSLKPRCNDEIFRARGECLDDSAGPAQLPHDAQLPAPLVPLAGAASRDIVVTKKKGSTNVASSAGASSPVIYTFRLAHH
jgi:Domain of unknown function (DUF4384)